jgi:hypothetical protein
MVGVQGFEPWTPWSQTRCATRLRYTPKLLVPSVWFEQTTYRLQGGCSTTELTGLKLTNNGALTQNRTANYGLQNRRYTT